MSYKTGGVKAVFETPSYYSYGEKYTVYNAVESVSDVSVYKVIDENGKEVNFDRFTEDDSVKGRQSLIDVVYYLKHYKPGRYSFGADFEDIIIEEMTQEEMGKIFGR